MLKLFFLERSYDVSGVSGTGKIAEGCLFDTGEAVVHWLGNHSSINIYKSMDDVIFIHGHGGSTRIIWNSTE